MDIADLDLNFDPPPRGHNSGDPGPVFDIEDATLAAQERARRHKATFDERMAGFKRWQTAIAELGIADDVMQGRSADFYKQLGETAKLIDGDREATKRPVLDLGRLIDAEYRGYTEPLEAARGAINRAMTAYAKQKAEAERLRLKAEADERMRQEREAAELAAAEAALNGEPEPESLPEPPEAALPTLAEASRVQGDYGTTASLRGKWVHEVTDLSLVPAPYLMVNDAAIKAAIKGGVRAIPGVRIYQETKVQVR